MKYKINRQIKTFQIESDVIFENEHGGKIISDPVLLSIFEFAENKSIDEIIFHFNQSNLTEQQIRCSIACLCEANILMRKNHNKPQLESPLFNNKVSVVIVTYNGEKWLKPCLSSLFRQNHNNFEIIIIDNNSSDKTVKYAEKFDANIRVIPLKKRVSFAKANNIGIKNASGEFILLLNQDIQLTKNALSELLNVYFRSNEDVAAVGSKLKFLWAPEFINGLGNVVRDHSWGMDLGLGNLDLGQFDQCHTLPSACFAAVLIPKKMFEEIGYLDPKFPMYYEDTEWCYRARILGKKIVAAPNAEFLHAFGGKIPTGTTKDLPAWKLRHAVYGRLRWVHKLISDKYKRQFVINYQREDWSNFFGYLQKGKIRYCLAIVAARLKLLLDFLEISKNHYLIKKNRKISDGELLTKTNKIPPTFEKNGLPILNIQNVTNYYLPTIRLGKTKLMEEFKDFRFPTSLLIVSNDIVAENMAGPGIRYLEMAKAISPHLSVTLAVPKETTFTSPGIKIAIYDESDPETLHVLAENHTHILISGYMPIKFPFLKTTAAKIIVDLYDPFVFENLHYYLNETIDVQKQHNTIAINTINELITIGDFFICGNERQRDLWMGLLLANQRINPMTFQQDPSLRTMIDVVGVGFPDIPPKGNSFLKKIIPNLTEESKIVLWGGGIWNWLDPITLIQAWTSVLENNPKAHLVMLGTRHPNPDVPLHEMANKSILLAKEIGQFDKSIHFIEWVSYKDREALLTEVDLGITLHPIHVETRYSIRTRVLDYMWAKLPIVITDGDITSKWVEQFDLGCVVPEFNSRAVSEAISAVLKQPKTHWESNYQQLHQEFRWSQVVKPMVNYCMEGRYAEDRKERCDSEDSFFPQPSKNKFRKALDILRKKGLLPMIKKVFTHLRFLIFRK